MPESDEKFTFFWRGPFSQWHPSRFVVDGITYTHAEQFMMAEKARLFGDDDALARILAAKSPRTQKQLGRGVANYDEQRWQAVRMDVVYRGSLAKFGQNKDLMDRLLATAGTTLVEASPYDKIWGIGLRADDPRAQSRATWQGLNLLGETLTRVREEVLKVKGFIG